MSDEVAIATPSYTEEDELSQKVANRSQPDDDLRDLGDNQIEDLSNDQVDSAQGTLVKTRPKDIKPTEYV